MTKLGYAFIVVLLLQLIAFTSLLYMKDPYRNNTIQPSTILFSEGDNTNWSEPTFDDSAWANIMPSGKNWWLRSKFKIDSTLSIQNVGVRISVLGSYDVYWDGNMLGSNGRVGLTQTSEVRGKQYSYFFIPFEQTDQGDHILALRVSRQFGEFRQYAPSLFLWDMVEVTNYQSLVIAYELTLAGFFITAAVYFLFITILYDRKTEHFVFGMLCFFLSQTLVVDMFKFMNPYPYDYHYLQVVSLLFLTLISAFLIPIFVAYKFNFNRKWLIPVLLVPCFAIVNEYTSSIDVFLMFSLIASICLSATIAFIQFRYGQQGSLLMLAAIILCGISLPFIQYLIFLGFLLIVTTNIILYAKQLSFDEVARQESLLRCKTLEIELLKKNIQPHFIMNSLMSSIAWIEESPKNGIALIEHLANEFSILIDISGKKFIPIAQEIELCENHLRIMSLRKRIQFRISLSGIDYSQSIPPAILHTVIENGITHNKPINKIMLFELQFFNNSESAEYRIIAHGLLRNSNRDTEGTGLKYIRARLQESYQDRWDISSCELQNGWETRIKILT